jgi:predicted transcriptional regulator
MDFKITIVSSSRPKTSNLNEELLWFAGSLGLFGLRDRDKSCFRIFIEMLKNSRNNIPISSEEIAQRLGLTRGTVIHHINKLMDSGIVVVTNNRYYLRVSTLKKLIEIMQNDLNQQLQELKEIAEDIDDKLKLN